MSEYEFLVIVNGEYVVGERLTPEVIDDLLDTIKKAIKERNDHAE